jgi:hypothetical protein
MDLRLWVKKNQLGLHRKKEDEVMRFGKGLRKGLACGMVFVLVVTVFAAVPMSVIGGMTFTETKLTASDGAAGDLFSSAFHSKSGDTIVIGAWYDDDKGLDSGSAYVFVKSGTGWTQQAKLTASDGGPTDRFGISTSIDDNTVVIGAWSGDSPTASYSGAAYVFERSGTTWTQKAKLNANDAAAGDRFGHQVAISEDGNTISVGAPGDDKFAGSAYVFVKSETGWVQQAKLVASDRAASDLFGGGAAISGDTIVVKARGDGSNTGSAYIFFRSGTTWSQQGKLTASDAALTDEFGVRADIDGDTVVVGAWNDDDGGSNSGSAYVFVRSGTSWTQQAKLTASDAAAGDLFGLGISISGDTIVVGAHRDDAPYSDSGSAYVYTRSGTTWTQQAKLTASDGAAGDRYGQSVFIRGDSIMIGAPYDDDNGADSGSVYLYKIIPPNSPPVITSISGQIDPIAIDKSFSMKGTFTDPDSGDTHCVYDHPYRQGCSWCERYRDIHPICGCL